MHNIIENLSQVVCSRPVKNKKRLSDNQNEIIGYDHNGFPIEHKVHPEHYDFFA